METWNVHWIKEEDKVNYFSKAVDSIMKSKLFTSIQQSRPTKEQIFYLKMVAIQLLTRDVQKSKTLEEFSETINQYQLLSMDILFSFYRDDDFKKLSKKILYEDMVKKESSMENYLKENHPLNNETQRLNRGFAKALHLLHNKDWKSWDKDDLIVIRFCSYSVENSQFVKYELSSLDVALNNSISSKFNSTYSSDGINKSPNSPTKNSTTSINTQNKNVSTFPNDMTNNTLNESANNITNNSLNESIKNTTTETVNEDMNISSDEDTNSTTNVEDQILKDIKSEIPLTKLKEEKVCESFFSIVENSIVTPLFNLRPPILIPNLMNVGSGSKYCDDKKSRNCLEGLNSFIQEKLSRKRNNEMPPPIDKKRRHIDPGLNFLDRAKKAILERDLETLKSLTKEKVSQIDRTTLLHFSSQCINRDYEILQFLASLR